MMVLIDKAHTPSGFGIHQIEDYLYVGSPCCGARLTRKSETISTWLCQECNRPFRKLMSHSLVLLDDGIARGASPALEAWVAGWTGYPVERLVVTVND